MIPGVGVRIGMVGGIGGTGSAGIGSLQMFGDLLGFTGTGDMITSVGVL